ncbi:MAG: hypothetical protein LH645_00970 [Actinomycetia bacterium]|nr:hypothetical protein [Actinomycetes bacterium]
MDPRTAFSPYSQAWDGSIGAEERAQLLAQAWADEGVLFDPESPGGVVGTDALVRYIEAQHGESPGMVVSEVGEPELVGNRLRRLWIQHDGNGIKAHSGVDFVEFGETPDS